MPFGTAAPQGQKAREQATPVTNAHRSIDRIDMTIRQYYAYTLDLDAFGFTGFFAPIVPGVNQTIFDQSVLIYIHAGQAPTVFLSAFHTVFGASTPVTLTGYLIDCTISACAPVAK